MWWWVLEEWPKRCVHHLSSRPVKGKGNVKFGLSGMLGFSFIQFNQLSYSLHYDGWQEACRAPFFHHFFAQPRRSQDEQGKINILSGCGMRLALQELAAELMAWAESIVDDELRQIARQQCQLIPLRMTGYRCVPLGMSRLLEALVRVNRNPTQICVYFFFNASHSQTPKP